MVLYALPYMISPGKIRSSRINRGSLNRGSLMRLNSFGLFRTLWILLIFALSACVEKLEPQQVRKNPALELPQAFNLPQDALKLVYKQQQFVAFNSLQQLGSINIQGKKSLVVDNQGSILFVSLGEVVNERFRLVSFSASQSLWYDKILSKEQVLHISKSP